MQGADYWLWSCGAGMVEVRMTGAAVTILPVRYGSRLTLRSALNLVFSRLWPRSVTNVTVRPNEGLISQFRPAAVRLA